MEILKTRKRCDSCKCGTPFHSTTAPPRTNYLYTENIIKADDVLEKNTHTRPSSASNVKSPHSNRKNVGNSSKCTSSESKITKKSVLTKAKINPLKNKEEHKSKMNQGTVQQLKQDLKTIKDQLFLLTKKRDEALDVTDELDGRYTNLINKCRKQERQIVELKNKNEKLLGKMKDQKSSDGVSADDFMTTKLYLDQYEGKLNSLYSEFLDTSKIMEQNRDKFCRCLKEKNSEYQEMNNSKLELSRVIEEKDMKYGNLLSDYQISQENERKFMKQNSELIQTIEDLENQLQQATTELEISRQEALLTAKQQQEMNETNKSYTCQLQLKSKEVCELNKALQELRNQLCKCNNNELNTNENNLEYSYDQLQHKYNHMLNKLNLYEQTNKKRLDEIALLKENEKNLVIELMKLKTFSDKLTNITNEHNLIISRLNSCNQDNSSVIRCQKAEMASKQKQIDLLKKSEDRLKCKIVQLQEDIVSMKISSAKANDGTTMLAAEDCSQYLTEELQDLISALYEEIDKTLVKDDQIQKQNRNICSLRCTLASKERELTGVRKQLEILRKQLCATEKQKQALAEHINKTTDTGCSDSEEGEYSRIY